MLWEEALDTDFVDMNICRFCLSDKSSLPLSVVENDNWSPVRYTEHMVSRHKKELVNLLEQKDVPSFLMGDYLFDQVLMSVCAYRIAQVRTDSMKSILLLLSATSPFFLQVKSHPLCGLVHFGEKTERFFQLNHQDFVSQQKATFLELITLIGSAWEDHSILVKPPWRKYWKSHPSHLNILRNFLHVFITTALFPPDHITQIFGCTRNQIEDWTDELIYLLQKKDLAKKDLPCFFDSLGLYLDYASPNMFFASLIGGSFSFFQQIHYQNYGNNFERVNSDQ